MRAVAVLLENYSQFFPERGASFHPIRSGFFPPSRSEQSHEGEAIRRNEKLPMKSFLPRVQ